MKSIAASLALILFLLFTLSFKANKPKRLTFEIEINKEVYINSLWGDAPQLALWLTDKKNNETISLFATHRTAQNDWIGKASCPVALPIWTSHNLSYSMPTRPIIKGRIEVDGTTKMSILIADPNHKTKKKYKYPLDVDGISGATPKNDLKGSIEFFEDNIYEVYLEVNCSGDYNEHYQERDMETGAIDFFGNGQPSIVYKGVINTVDMTIAELVVYGISDQHISIDQLNTLTDSITTAKNLIKKISIEFD